MKMIDREITCKACEGTGMLSDDEGWQYTCNVCHGKGELNADGSRKPVKLMSVDDNNRLLD